MTFSAVMWGPRQQAGSGAELERGIRKNVLLIVQDSSKGVTQKTRGFESLTWPCRGLSGTFQKQMCSLLPWAVAMHQG